MSIHYMDQMVFTLEEFLGNSGMDLLEVLNLWYLV